MAQELEAWLSGGTSDNQKTITVPITFQDSIIKWRIFMNKERVNIISIPNGSGESAELFLLSDKLIIALWISFRKPSDDGFYVPELKTTTTTTTTSTTTPSSPATTKTTVSVATSISTSVSTSYKYSIQDHKKRLRKLLVPLPRHIAGVWKSFAALKYLNNFNFGSLGVVGTWKTTKA